MSEDITLAQRIDEFAAIYGSMRRVAEELGIDVGYLSRLRAGEKASPSAAMLQRLGLYRVVTYRRIKKQWTATPLTPRTKSA